VSVLSVVGARPQFVKAFPVSGRLRREHEEVLVHTGQHYDDAMSDVFFRELPIPTPDENLGVGSGSHATQTAQMLTELDAVLDEYDPELVLVYGDTNSTLAAALAAAKRDPLVAHVEAGLRSHNWSMPEEVNRVLTDHCADLLFAPSDRAVSELASEAITSGVTQTGDVMYDALLAARERASEVATVLEDRPFDEGEFVLATVHRPRNTDDPDRLATILDALAATPRPVVLPAHPRTVDRLESAGLLPEAREEVTLLDPQGYLDFVRLVDAADRVVTDSGGVQKEAFYLETPCVTLREETEWPETITAGWNVLVGADPELLARALERDFADTRDATPYGDGTAAARIVEELTDALD